mgnify:FL=1|jgi:hypothetical protein|tara:strand:- start:128 stop:910 length:783 start_codon:yes stop_codon:yes gene_type:complete
MNFLNQTSKEVNKVYKTSDLSMFNPTKGNRPTNPNHIRKLAHSITVNGLLQNPIIVNEKMNVIDGQHRLKAAKEAKSSIYYIIVKDYGLKEVQTLNLNQKNWNKKDFMNGYADMGIESYKKLKEFYSKNSEFSLGNCVSLCSNRDSSGFDASNKFRAGSKKPTMIKQVFNEGTWKGNSFNLGQDYANKLKSIEPFYDGYNRISFVNALMSILKNKEFNFETFLKKLQIKKLDHCVNVTEYKSSIEDIYNYKNREKVNLRY